MNRSLQKALDDFILERVNSCSVNESKAIGEAYDALYESTERLRDEITPEQEKLLTACENAFSLYEGEIMNSYYRAGFSDAVVFLLEYSGSGER